MKIVVLKETYPNEKRVSITPDVANLLKKDKHEVLIEKGSGLSAGFSDEEYAKFGADLLDDRSELVKNADLICKLNPSNKDSNNIFPEIEYGKNTCVILGMFSGYLHKEYIQSAQKKSVKLVSMNLVPRISRLQNSDALSSQNTLIGYRAVIEACNVSNRSFPMLMGSAGTIFASKVLVLGTGVAGLQAIATAKRLGALVWAYDVRANTKEQVESLGAKFIHPGEIKDLENISGYANSLDQTQNEIQEEFLSKNIGQFDVILTFAQIPNQASPVLINEKVFAQIKKGSVIVDATVEFGGNVIYSKKNSLIEKNSVKILGLNNLASNIAHDASKLYAKNIYNILKIFCKEDKLDLNDELLKKMTLT